MGTAVKLNYENLSSNVNFKSYYLYEDIKSEKAINMLAEFAVLNLNSNYRVLKLGDPFAESQTSYYHKSIGIYIYIYIYISVMEGERELVPNGRIY